MARHVHTAVLAASATALALAVVGCGSSSGSVACDDAAFRAQDEELYVTGAAVGNAIGGAGAAAVLLTDLRLARTALTDYLDAHPPCSEALRDVETGERRALVALDDAVSALEQGADATPSLRIAASELASAQDALTPAP